MNQDTCWIRWGVVHIATKELIGVYRSQSEASKSMPIVNRPEYLIHMIKIERYER
jgi:hypothetical protein